MKAWPAMLTLVALGIGSAANAAAPTVASLKEHRRIVLIATPNAQDPRAVIQRRVLDSWSKEAADRDISVVEVTDTGVTGAGDDAAALRKRYHLEPGRFEVLLIGKDGHVALRSARPVDAAILQHRIDAMPMRQAGDR